jgi:hypothetical protein
MAVISLTPHALKGATSGGASGPSFIVCFIVYGFLGFAGAAKRFSFLPIGSTGYEPVTQPEMLCGG